MVAERQTHAMPEDRRERERLARRAGYPDAAAMEGDLAAHRSNVEARFKDLLRVASGDAPRVDPRAAAAADPEATTQQRSAALAELGFDQPEASAEELARLARKRGTPFQDPQPLGPALLMELAAAPDPDQALRHLPDLFGRLANPRATSVLLAGVGGDREALRPARRDHGGDRARQAGGPRARIPLRPRSPLPLLVRRRARRQPRVLCAHRTEADQPPDASPARGVPLPDRYPPAAERKPWAAGDLVRCPRRLSRARSAPLGAAGVAARPSRRRRGGFVQPRARAGGRAERVPPH